MILTKRDNIRNVLRGKTPAWVPFSPNFDQWFRHHQNFKTLPKNLQGCDHYIDAMKVLDCDIFSRNLEGGYCESDTTCLPQVTTEPASTGPRTTALYATPFGDIRSISQQQTRLSTSYQQEYLVKDWQRDGDAFRYVLDQKKYDWDDQFFQATNEHVGDEGVVNISVAQSPLKMLHQFFGLDDACLFIMDEPDQAKSLCDQFWESLRPVFKKLANHPDVESVMLMDNVDTPFYPPVIVSDYWAPYVKEAADLMRQHGKYLFVHACGQLSALSQTFSDCRVTGLEGIAHPPLGDWTARQAQTCHDDFVFVGGFSAHEQETMNDQQVRDFYEKYLNESSKQRFIFSSSCQTSINTTWDRIKLVRDICRQWGGLPTTSTITPHIQDRIV